MHWLCIEHSHKPCPHTQHCFHVDFNWISLALGMFRLIIILWKFWVSVNLMHCEYWFAKREVCDDLMFTQRNMDELLQRKSFQMYCDIG
jgi:hypothetical protein